jgi:hypothetical protein
MPRIILALLLLSITCGAYTQDWQCFRPGVKYFFKDPMIQAEQEVKSLRIDSSGTSAGYTYHHFASTIRSTGDFAACYTVHGDSWMGQGMLVYPDGRNCFFNHNADTITINTKAEVNSSWKMCSASAGNSVYASVSWKMVSQVLGSTDSVKLIDLQVRDSMGNNVIHPFNNIFIVLSKSYSLIDVINLYIFPDTIGFWWQIPLNEPLQRFSLAGYDAPATGTTNLTYAQAFDFNPGDEFHSLAMDVWTLPPPSHHDTTYEIRKILQRIEYPGNDSVSYAVHRMSHHIYYYAGTLMYNTYINDTILETYSNLSETGRAVSQLPGEVIWDSAGLAQTEVYTNSMQLRSDSRREKVLPSYYYHFIDTGDEDCLAVPIFDFCTGDACYIEGLGGPYGSCEYFENFYRRELVYYSQGDTSWGTPLDPGVVLLIPELKEGNKGDIRVYPMPVKDRLVVEIHNADCNSCLLRIRNILGEEIIQQVMTLENNELSLSVPSGLYIIQIQQDHRILYTGKVIVTQ